MGGGDCNTPPSCTGDTVSCGILLQTWHTRCDFAPKSDGPSDSDIAAESADPASVASDETIDESTFDIGGFGLATDQCPQIPDISVLGNTYHFSSPWCDALAFLGNLIVLLSYVLGYRILAKG
jgi:hypothetical protein